MNDDNWYQKMPGLMLFSEEKTVLDRLLKPLPGHCLLQIGGPFEKEWINTTPFVRVCFLDSTPPKQSVQPFIQADPESLPVQTESIDSVCIVHTLEFSPHPEKMLSEAHRVLKPNGKLIILCFNALGIWQPWRLLSKDKTFPFGEKFYTSGRIKRCLKNLDCQIDFYQTVGFRPPFKNTRYANHTVFLETLGQLCLPFMGAVWVLVATKNIPGMTPLPLKPWLIEPSIRSVHT